MAVTLWQHLPLSNVCCGGSQQSGSSIRPGLSLTIKTEIDIRQKISPRTDWHKNQMYLVNGKFYQICIFSTLQIRENICEKKNDLSEHNELQHLSKDKCNQSTVGQDSWVMENFNFWTLHKINCPNISTFVILLAHFLDLLHHADF